MKLLLRSFILFTLSICAGHVTMAQTKTVELCVLLTAEIQKSPAQITLKWPMNATALSYTVARKSKYETEFVNLKTGISGSSTSYTDATVQAGNEYEYAVYRSHSGYSATGYLSAAIELPPVHSRGTVLFLIESSLRDSMLAEIETASLDMAGDGWKVIHRFVSKDSSPVHVQGVIAEAARWCTNPLRAIYILGHVPVPYSGNYGLDAFYSVPPDGHPDHGGAWPADVFYGTNPGLYSDNLVNNNGSRAENKNLKSDGKYDQIEIPGSIAYHIGRVDLRSMTKFQKSEVALLKQYIQKSHDYRMGNTPFIKKGLIDENFAVSVGGFASSAWRNFSAFYGSENILDRVENGVDYFTNLQDSNYQFAYGTGGGSYTSAGGIGSTDDFVTKRGALFNMLFGSYFGDWDVANNFLRAPLAAKENGLVSVWSGRPWWNLHHMALGETIGFSTWVSQSNKTTYVSTPFVNNIHIALMGDPTLRIHIMKPAGYVEAIPSGNKTTVHLSWTASTEPGIMGYHIYRSASKYGTFELANTVPVTTTTYIDNSPYADSCFYMVRAIKLEVTPAGSFYNLSQGSFAKAVGISGKSANTTALDIQQFVCFPNPANQSIYVRLNQMLQHPSEVRVYDQLGRLVQNSSLFPGNQEINLNVSNLPNGSYWIEIGRQKERIIVLH